MSLSIATNRVFNHCWGFRKPCWWLKTPTVVYQRTYLTLSRSMGNVISLVMSLSKWLQKYLHPVSKYTPPLQNIINAIFFINDALIYPIVHWKRWIDEVQNRVNDMFYCINSIFLIIDVTILIIDSINCIINAT